MEQDVIYHISYKSQQSIRTTRINGCEATYNWQLKA